MKKMRFWLTYDLGIGGDFSSMYSWLDDNNAIECGNNNALIDNYEYPDTVTTDEQFAVFLKNELEEKVRFNLGKDRIYAAWVSIDVTRNGRGIGTFIIGKRKASPWEGFGEKTENTIDE